MRVRGVVSRERVAHAGGRFVFVLSYSLTHTLFAFCHELRLHVVFAEADSDS